jgi:Fe-S cluster assembly protein SufD
MSANVTSLPVKSRFRPDTAAIVENLLGSNAAATQLRAQGLPTNLLERFKFSNLSAAFKKINLTESVAQIHLSEDTYSQSNNVQFNTTDSEPSLWMLSRALNGTDLHLTFPKNTKSQPLYLNWADHVGTAQNLRVKIEVQAGADVMLIEKTASRGQGWKNQSVEIDVAANARLIHVRILGDDATSLATSVIGATVARDARYECLTLNTGNAWSRHEYHMRLTGTNGFAGLYGLNLLKGSQFSDTTILIEHQAPHCQSSQFFRNLIDDSAHGVFQGKIHVHQVAQQTDGYQLCNNLILSPQAVMNVKPELEIYADDVKCSHGTTTGALDETPLFYLRSRGIPEKEARRLLIESFVGEVLDKIDHAPTRDEMDRIIADWLS